MTRHDPFTEFERLFDQLRRTNFGAAGSARLPMGWGDDQLRWDANLRLESTDDGYVVMADLPGFEREEIDLRFQDGVLRLTATHDVSSDESADVSTRQRRQVNERIRVPGSVDREAISATYRNGVLEVHLPTETDADETAIDID